MSDLNQIDPAMTNLKIELKIADVSDSHTVEVEVGTMPVVLIEPVVELGTLTGVRVTSSHSGGPEAIADLLAMLADTFKGPGEQV